jgi:hypothetical protein
MLLRLLPLVLLCLALSACFGPSGRRMSPDEYREMEQLNASSTDSPRSGLEREKRRRELDERDRDLSGRTADHVHDLEALASRRAQLVLEHAIELADEHLELARGQRELREAQEDLAHFTGEVKDRRVTEDALDVQASRDRLMETREELAQLELMYSESELGDATAEIVLERTRRRLTLAELRHRVRQERSAELQGHTLPRMEAEYEAAQMEAQIGLENIKRRLEKQDLERRAAEAQLKHEAGQLEREGTDITEDGRVLSSDRDTIESNRPVGIPAARAP